MIKVNMVIGIHSDLSQPFGKKKEDDEAMDVLDDAIDILEDTLNAEE